MFIGLINLHQFLNLMRMHPQEVHAIITVAYYPFTIIIVAMFNVFIVLLRNRFLSPVKILLIANRHLVSCLGFYTFYCSANIIIAGNRFLMAESRYILYFIGGFIFFIGLFIGRFPPRFPLHFQISKM
jgi:hypothetical protein